jgi:hypothetical protein
MTSNPDYNPPADEVPVDDAVEQQQPAALDPEDTGLDPEHVASRLEADANVFDVIEQAIAVPLPEEQADADID